MKLSENVCAVHILRKKNRSTKIMTEVEVATVFTTAARTIFKASCALNRPFEHINRRITFEPSYCYYSTWANS